MKLLQKMQPQDIPEVIKIIASHDEDDAEAAEQMYNDDNGLYNQYVLKNTNDQVIGVTGFEAPFSCVNTYYLSWTYIDKNFTNQGHGTKILTELLNHLSSIKARKVFIKVSNYVDDDGNDIYYTARKLYEKLGFKIELTQPDYFDTGEDQIIYSIRINEKSAEEEMLNYEQDHKNIRFIKIYELDETEKSYTFDWDEDGESLFSNQDIEIGINEAKSQNARLIFLGFPSIYKGIQDKLINYGFNKIGFLEDYYEDGVHEDHYIYKL